MDIGHPKVLDPGPGGELPREATNEETGSHPIAAIATLSGVYVGFTTWTYFAWYRKHKALSEFKWGGDGFEILHPSTYFGRDQYAGGSDKLGHAWSTMGLARATTETLVQLGGYDRFHSTLLGAGLADLLFFGVEIKDGFYYEFSYGDFFFDSIGAALAVAMSLSPRFDEMFDFRVQYFPSTEYRAQLDHGNVNIAEDYSGEIYMAAFHLGAIHALRDQSWGGWSRFVDVAAGFGTRGYKPDEPAGQCPVPGGPGCYPERQSLYLGVSLNAQGLFDWLLEGRPSTAARVGHKVTHAMFEMFNAPYTFVPAKWSRSGQGVNGGA